MKATIFLLIALLTISLSLNFYSCGDGNEQPVAVSAGDSTKPANSIDISTTQAALGTTVDTVSKKAPLIQPGDQAGFANLLIPKDSAFKWIKRYLDKKHKRDKMLSRSVWYDKDVFLWIAQYLQTAPKEVDGIRVYTVQYPDKFRDMGGVNEERAKQWRNRTTMIMVPTKKKVAQFDEWQEMSKKYHQVLNHGELCPSNCNHDPNEPQP